jgi:transcriptional regulator with XRE-family HTH domain
VVKPCTEEKFVTTYEAIAGEVRAELARQKLSGVRVARQLGWTQNYISRRLSGTVPFDVADLQAIADLLEVSVTEFFQVPTVDVRRPGSCPELEAAA